MSDTIKLYCWVLDDAPDHIDEIDISSNKSVAVLKDTFKIRNPNTFPSTNTQKLDLWAVLMLEAMMRTRLGTFRPEEGVNGAVKLWPTTPLSEVFPSPLPKDHVRIIVVQPTGTSSKRPPSRDEAISPPMKKRRLELLMGSGTIYKSEADLTRQPNRPVLPGHSNFDHLIETPNIIAADKTRFIEELDKAVEYQYMFLRPRRWGKTTFLQMLADYYDKTKKDQFDNTFGQLYIGKNPTQDRSSLLVLLFDFSTITTSETQHMRDEFNGNTSVALSKFLTRNAKILGVHDNKQVVGEGGAEAIERVLNIVQASGEKLFVGVDEYDAPANSCLLSPHESQFPAVAELFKSRFFAIIKKSLGSVVKKYWLTGVLPAFRDGISPLTATDNISMNPQYNAVCGLTGAEVKAIATAFLGSPRSAEEIERELEIMKQFCSPGHAAEKLYNPQLVFTHLRCLLEGGEIQPYT